ncbi:MAG: class I adenylate-forming enzyme family protein [Acidimicrobiia bacterium]
MATARNTAELLRIAAREHPDREAYVHGEKRVTYRWLDRAADGFAATLLDDVGVGPGDVVCLMLGSSIKFAACYLGALRAGAITSAINLRLGVNEQSSILARTDPVVTVLGDGAEIPRGANPGKVLHVSELGTALGREPVPDAHLPAIAETDAACIVWTSGTTGAPKGAVYDHARMAAISRNMGQLTEPGDRRLVVLPFAHVGYMTRMWDELANGTTIVLAGEPWSATETLRLIRDERITMGTGVPTQWELVLAHPDLARTDFSQLRVCGIGGAAISPELVRRMRETLGCPVLSRYTSTEAGVTTSTVIGDPDEVVATTVGRAVPEVELRVVAPGSGEELGPDEVGEIVCRSPAMMRGYWRDPDLTATVIDADGWLHTGDLGTLDADGLVRIVGRLKEMYIRGGYNVYPTEVEAVLSGHPAIARVAVVGLPDPVLGEVGGVFAVAADPANPPQLADLRDWCRARIADYKAPDRLVVVDELPVTPMHKVDKTALRATYETTEET